MSDQILIGNVRRSMHESLAKDQARLKTRIRYKFSNQFVFARNTQVSCVQHRPQCINNPFHRDLVQSKSICGETTNFLTFFSLASHWSSSLPLNQAPHRTIIPRNFIDFYHDPTLSKRHRLDPSIRSANKKQRTL
jgi:hypothetical protein